jgi:hypothetical protein
MLNDAGDERASPRSPWRLHFSLLALFISFTVVCLLLAWWVQPNYVVATTLFRVDSTAPVIVSDGGRPAGPENFQIVKKTQLALLKSHFVLNAAIRKPGIAALPVFHGQADPVEWLHEHLESDFPQDGEILAISLRGRDSQAADLVRIVDAVANAYQDEAINRETQLRLANRDSLARSLENLNREIQRKWEELFDIVRESGQPGIFGSKTQQDQDIEMLGAIKKSILHWEDEIIEAKRGGESATVEMLNERTAKLRDQQAMLEERITAREEVPPELSRRQRELEQLQTVAHEIAVKLERLDIEAQAPPRIEQVQPAVSSSAD